MSTLLPETHRDSDIVMTDRYQSVFNQEDSRYISFERELKGYLRELYAGKVVEDYDFKVRVSLLRRCGIIISMRLLCQWQNRNDRWSFEGPEDLDEVSVPRLLLGSLIAD